VIFPGVRKTTSDRSQDVWSLGPDPGPPDYEARELRIRLKRSMGISLIAEYISTTL
jgi:hypothetical protein